MMLTSPDQLAELFSAGRYHDLIAAAQAAEVTPNRSCRSVACGGLVQRRSIC